MHVMGELKRIDLHGEYGHLNHLGDVFIHYISFVVVLPHSNKQLKHPRKRLHLFVDDTFMSEVLLIRYVTIFVRQVCLTEIYSFC